MASLVDSVEAGGVWGRLVERYKCPGSLPIAQGRWQDVTGAEWQAASRFGHRSVPSMIIIAFVERMIMPAYMHPTQALEYFHAMTPLHLPNSGLKADDFVSILEIKRIGYQRIIILKKLVSTVFAVDTGCSKYPEGNTVHVLRKLHGFGSSELVLDDWSSAQVS